VFDCGEVENELELCDKDSEDEAETNNAFIQYQRRREVKLKEKEQKKLTQVVEKPSVDGLNQVGSSSSAGEEDEEKKDGDRL